MKLLKFEASWCQPCKQLSETLSSMDMPWPVEVIDIDLEENREQVINRGVRSVPTLILLDNNNKVVRRITGNNMTRSQLLDAFDLKG